MANLLHLTGQALRSSTGTPYTSAKAYFYETGTTTPKNTYSDAGLTSANTNPVIADGTTGIFPDIYLLAGRYKVVLQQSDGTAIDTWDPYDATQQIITATAAPSPAYPFMVYHNSTDGHRYRRNAANNAWIDEGLVDSLGNTTTVTNQLAGTATNEFSTPDTVAALWQRGADITAGSTLSLPATGGGVYNLTGGATTINGISSASGGRKIVVRSNTTHTFTHNGTSFIMFGAKSILAEADDLFEFTNEAAQDATGSNWRLTDYLPSSGIPKYLSSAVASKTANYTLTVADRGKSIRFAGLSADVTLTLPSAASCGDGFVFYVSNEDHANTNPFYAVTVDPNGAELIDGQASRKAFASTRLTLLCDGTGWRTVGGEWIVITPQQAITAAANANIAHGQGIAPKRVWPILVNTTGEFNYTAGDFAFMNTQDTTTAAASSGIMTGGDATNLFYVIGSTACGRILNKTTGAIQTPTTGNWKLHIVGAF